MKTIEESILAAMDCADSGILPYLPYILQDFWEIGSDPAVMINLIRKHITNTAGIKILDLGCGKGAVSVNIAKQMNCECYGIDAIPEFISFAVSKAEECGVGNLCKFEVGDIREKVRTLGRYDVVILGAVGQVFGNYYETLSLLKHNLKEGGIILIDDGYIEDENSFRHKHVLLKNILKKQVSEAGMQITEEVITKGDNSIQSNYETEYSRLVKRCEELCIKYPHKSDMFIEYTKRQKVEYDNFKNNITCLTMAIIRKE